MLRTISKVAATVAGFAISVAFIAFGVGFGAAVLVDEPAKPSGTGAEPQPQSDSAAA